MPGLRAGRPAVFACFRGPAADADASACMRLAGVKSVDGVERQCILGAHAAAGRLTLLLSIVVTPMLTTASGWYFFFEHE